MCNLEDLVDIKTNRKRKCNISDLLKAVVVRNDLDHIERISTLRTSSYYKPIQT
jgi:hypothetical protein